MQYLTWQVQFCSTDILRQLQIINNKNKLKSPNELCRWDFEARRTNQPLILCVIYFFMKQKRFTQKEVAIFNFPAKKCPVIFSTNNRPRSIYQYSSMAPRLSGQNCNFFKFPLSLNSQKIPRYKENNTKYRGLTWKPRSHVRILIYRTWPIDWYMW